MTSKRPRAAGTSSRRTSRRRPCRMYSAVVAMQPGVVMADNEIHIRGGRTHENAYLLDGISVQDPMAGSGFGLQLSPASIQEVEVITGGYNAEYGQATSGIVNITTREGSDRYNGAVGYRTDHFGFNNDTRSNWNTDISRRDAQRAGTCHDACPAGPRCESSRNTEFLRLCVREPHRWVHTLGGDRGSRLPSERMGRESAGRPLFFHL
ncbi:MAG: TonB-dependent receptor plug domain-containing protein [Ignavibacteriales bacterium]|nr:TonB-dependent receptor plug domain-containing protein [Ignavibacteriales bacterium]